MAEIKSTLEMVMERAARMTAEVSEAPAGEDGERQGMRQAASFLNGDEIDLMSYLKEQKPAEQMKIRSGMVRTLLRNILLPRDESISPSTLLALQATLDLSGNTSDVVTICSELRQILEQYNQHKEQVRQQLDEAIRAQLKQKLLEQGQNVEDEISLNPSMHPQYREEWVRVSADLNNQYNQALDQRKEAIRQRLDR